ncbi:uncharacterized protein LOC123540777 [Mercenaria mercenaria]|uniref:uncharacterized protein LOC123540777 n=1 Tax=Mercenaria mercenaria TaxID=6596 RepID=UPI001E1D77C1|nr:uncharacterized protein LOC123540777 [Mercenaria mercenaria]
MSRTTQENKPNNGLFGEFKDPFKSKPYVDPLKRDKNTYKDPLNVQDGEYSDPVKSVKVKLPEYRPYDSYHEYEMPDIDPLTGKPRRRRAQRTKKQEEPKTAKQPLLFPPQLGSSVGSMKRTLMLQENLNV